jgi:leader peptidase (prepilin peptidase) / N-methyltransferase
MSSPFALVLALVLGLVIGSFLNVCIHRLPRRESIVRPRSRCPACGKPLEWFDNIPVASWIVLGARCRHCGAPISVRYPIVELATAAAAVVIVWLTPPGPLLVSRLILAAALIALFFIDLEHRLLPNVITVSGIVVGFLLSLFAPPGPVQSLIGIVVGGGMLLAIAGAYYVLRRLEGMGMGDVKMLAMIGAFLGWQSVIVTLILSSFLGAIAGIALLLIRGAGLRHALPFGSFLAIAAFVSMLAGDAIVPWYLRQL